MKSVWFLILTILCACGQQSTGTSASSNEFMTVDSQVPADSGTIKLLDLTGNAIFPSKDKVLILNLWATWCKPCIEEMPALIAMSEQLPDSYELILASDEDLDRINKFLNARSLNAQFARLESDMESLGVYSLPTTLIINSKSEILETIVGIREWNTQEQIDQITAFKP